MTKLVTRFLTFNPILVVSSKETYLIFSYLLLTLMTFLKEFIMVRLSSLRKKTKGCYCKQPYILTFKRKSMVKYSILQLFGYSSYLWTNAFAQKMFFLCHEQIVVTAISCYSLSVNKTCHIHLHKSYQRILPTLFLFFVLVLSLFDTHFQFTK